MDLVSNRKRTYEDFKKQLSPTVKPLLEQLREYCFSLGKNVIEDVRMHRIVFCKSMTFRNFADIEPLRDTVMLKIRRDRKEPLREIEVNVDSDLNELKKLLSDAYSSIH